MLQYTNEQLATIIALPLVTIVLIWTVAIFHKNRKKWGPYDIVITAILVQSVLRNLSVLIYTTLLIVAHNTLNYDYCSAVTWLLNSIHTFQASSLTTLAIIALFSVKLYIKQQNLKQYLTATHVVYHMFCLTTLCACVGVAAILAQKDKTIASKIAFKNYHDMFQNDVCKFMPYQLDVKFNVFIIVLHIFLALVSAASCIFICLYHIRLRRNGFDYLKKSTSDLSELSLNLSVVNPNENLVKNYYDTYTIQRSTHLDNNYVGGYDCQNGLVVQNSVHHPHHQNGYCNKHDVVWNSDVSNISTTVSSTNSRRPCLKTIPEEKDTGAGLQTMYPVLIVCYLFNHLPVIILCIFPWLISPWPVAGAALWMGQIQDLLIPIGLGLVDSRFCKWVSRVYRCSERKITNDKLPHVGLDGKFRHFGSQPQSLEISQAHPERTRVYSSNEPKFPITNGSLYTSLDGRLPIIHNYRRHKDHRGAKPLGGHSLYMDLHSLHLKRQDYNPRPENIHNVVQTAPLRSVMHCEYPRMNCDSRSFQSSSNVCYNPERQPKTNLAAISRPANYRNEPKPRPVTIRSPANRRLVRNRKPLQKRISVSQESLRNLPLLQHGQDGEYSTPVDALRSPATRSGFNSRRSKSEDSLNGLQQDLQRFKQNPGLYQAGEGKETKASGPDFSCLSSDDEYLTDSVNLNESLQDFDGSSQSSYSITTEANCDFDFYNTGGDDGNQNHKQSEKSNFPCLISSFGCELTEDNYKKSEAKLARPQNPQPKFGSSNNVHELGVNFRITRSNSKRSLDNLQTYIDTESVSLNGNKIQRSSSYVTMEDKHKFLPCNNPARNNSKLSDSSRLQNANYYNQTGDILQNRNASIAYLDDVYNHNIPKDNIKARCKNTVQYYGGSVPDFKRIFISDYL